VGNGFRFTPASGAVVFVDIGPMPSTALLAALTVGTTASVTGILEAPPTGAPSGTISEVDATSITIGSKTYTLRHVP
jgi:cell division ATPase FtsA